MLIEVLPHLKLFLGSSFFTLIMALHGFTKRVDPPRWRAWYAVLALRTVRHRSTPARNKQLVQVLGLVGSEIKVSPETKVRCT